MRRQRLSWQAPDQSTASSVFHLLQTRRKNFPSATPDEIVAAVIKQGFVGVSHSHNSPDHFLASLIINIKNPALIMLQIRSTPIIFHDLAACL
jgi:hypothetical protein